MLFGFFLPFFLSTIHLHQKRGRARHSTAQHRVFLVYKQQSGCWCMQHTHTHSVHSSSSSSSEQLDNTSLLPELERTPLEIQYTHSLCSFVSSSSTLAFSKARFFFSSPVSFICMAFGFTLTSGGRGYFFFCPFPFFFFFFSNVHKNTLLYSVAHTKKRRAIDALFSSFFEGSRKETLWFLF